MAKQAETEFKRVLNRLLEDGTWLLRSAVESRKPGKQPTLTRSKVRDARWELEGWYTEAVSKQKFRDAFDADHIQSAPEAAGVLKGRTSTRAAQMIGRPTSVPSVARRPRCSPA